MKVYTEKNLMEFCNSNKKLEVKRYVLEIDSDRLAKLTQDFDYLLEGILTKIIDCKIRLPKGMKI